MVNIKNWFLNSKHFTMKIEDLIYDFHGKSQKDEIKFVLFF